MHGRNTGSILYRGRSMGPLFEEGDEVFFRPYDNRGIKRGDVIVFSQPGRPGLIIHRVIRADRSEIRTRGDNNPSADPWLLNPNRILGRVVSIRRGRKRLAVRGGIAAEWSSRILHNYRVWRTRFIHALDPVWNSRFFYGFLSEWLPERYRPRILSFNRTYGQELVLLMGERTIGRRFAGNDSWHIRRRWRPFVNMNAVENSSYTALRSGR